MIECQWHWLHLLTSSEWASRVCTIECMHNEIKFGANKTEHPLTQMRRDAQQQRCAWTNEVCRTGDWEIGLCLHSNDLGTVPPTCKCHYDDASSSISASGSTARAAGRKLSRFDQVLPHSALAKPHSLSVDTPRIATTSAHSMARNLLAGLTALETQLFPFLDCFLVSAQFPLALWLELSAHHKRHQLIYASSPEEMMVPDGGRTPNHPRKVVPWLFGQAVPSLGLLLIDH